MESMRLEGYSATMKKFGKLGGALGQNGEKMLPILMRAGNVVRSHIRAQAPLGPTGNLKRMIGVTKARNTVRNEPAVRVHSFAPHSHLIEYGHITTSGSHTTPNPYFHRGVASSKGIAQMIIMTGMEKLIKRAAML